MGILCDYFSIQLHDSYAFGTYFMGCWRHYDNPSVLLCTCVWSEAFSDILVLLSNFSFDVHWGCFLLVELHCELCGFSSVLVLLVCQVIVCYLPVSNLLLGLQSLEHVQVMCTLLQKSSHASTASQVFYRLDALPDQPCQCTEGNLQVSCAIIKYQSVYSSQLGMTGFMLQMQICIIQHYSFVFVCLRNIVC